MTTIKSTINCEFKPLYYILRIIKYYVEFDQRNYKEIRPSL